MVNYIGLNIKFLCHEKNLSQKEFGIIFNASQSTIGGYISGRTEPNISFLQNVSKHFAITIDDFININLKEQGYIKKALQSGMVTEPAPDLYGDTSKIIAAQEKTIASLEKQAATADKYIVVLEKQNNLLEQQVANLEQKLIKAS